MHFEVILCVEIESRKTIREIVIFQPVLTFYDVYGDECQNFGHFSHSQPEMKVKHVFKAKKVVFRERNHEKTQKLIFLYS